MRELLATLRENKIHISLENENLKLKFDGDGIPDSILETIKKNKEQLILFLKNNNQPNRLISAIPKVEQQEDYALSSAQHSIWLLSQIDVVALGYNISEIFKFKGTLNIEILELAIKEVIKRHEILRTVFKQNSFGEVRQVILSSSDFKFNLNYADVSNLEDPEKKLEKIIDDEIGYQFDLSSESLFRVNLIRTGSEEIVLCFVIQHIISDGWSINLLINEMLTFYMAFCQNKSIRLEPLRIQYKDYSEWQQNNLNSELLEKNKLFWTNQFNDELPVLELPTLKARPIVKTYNVNTLWHNYSDDFLSKLKLISKNGDTTLFSTLMSVMNLLLYRYSGQDDVILGTAIAGRENQELENQIGMYINTLAIRTKLNGSENFTELLSKVKNVLLQAFQHQDYPFNELINELKHKRSKNRSPLFDILVILQNQKSIQANEFKVSDLEISKISEYQNSTSQFDMKFEFFEMENGLKLGLEYNTDIYDSAFIHRFFSHFENIVDSIFQNSELPIGHLSYLSKEEVNQLLLGFNDTKMVYPDTKTVIDLFEDQVEKTPESIAVVFEEIELTYKELNEKSNQLAHYLRENHAIQPDDLIAVKLDRSEKIIIAILGVLKSGAAYVPIDVNYPKERIAYIEKDSNSKIVIDEKVLEKFSEIQENFPKENIVKINNPHDLVYVIYTSGTTGNPKGVMVEHGNLVSSTISRIEFYQVQKTLLLISSYAFDSSVAVIWGGLINGGALVIENESVIKDSESIVKRIIKSEVTDMLCVPSYYGFLFNELKKNKDSLKLKNLILAGEQVKLDLIASHKEDFENITLFNEYGPTEGTVWATVFKINDFENLVIPIGKPISNTQIYILDDNLEPVVIGGSGKLYVSGSGVARGYLNKPELTLEKFVPNPFIAGKRMYDTGDLACWLPDGNIEFLGRKDHQVKIRGYRIELGEIENTILQYSEDLKQVVVEVKENNQEKVLVAYFVSAANLEKAQLRSFLQEKLPDYMVPGFYIELEKLPLTPNGKIDRNALPGISVEDVIRKEYVGPRNKTEENLVLIWQEVLGIEQIGITDNFFELGGHSLIIAQVINRTHKQLGKTVSFKVFFANPTIEGLSKELQEKDFIAIPTATEAASYPLTSSQSRLWILSQLEGGSLAYNMPAAVKLTGVVDGTKFEESFKRLISRHEILRTSFKTDQSGDVRQYIVPTDQVNFKIAEQDYSARENQGEAIADYLQAINNEPFDLEQAPLVRASLIKLKEEEHVFFLSLHHIIGDGWSIEVLISEVVKTYNALTQGTEIALPELSLQYKDYAVWLNDEIQQEQYQASEDYWLEQFAGELPVLDLPSFKTRPLIQTYNGDSLTHRFSRVFLDKLKRFSKEQDLTLFMSLMAGINALLHKYTGQDDIIIGTPIAGREHPDLEHQIGLYLNTLAIRTQLKKETSFADLAASQKETLLGAYEYQSYPFDVLVGKLNLKRDTSRTALFDILVVLQNQGQLNNLNNEELANFQVSDYEFSRKTSQFDVSFTFAETEGLDLTIEYNTDIYDAYLIERMFTHFENLVTGALEQPEMPIHDIDYLTKEEEQELLVGFNDTAVAYPKDKTIIDLFEDQVASTPNNIAVVFEETELTYQELNEKANQLAFYLRDRYAVEADDLIGIKLDRSEKMLIVILGILKSGAAYVPIDVNYPQERIAYIEKDSNSKIVIDEEALGVFAEVQQEYSKANPEKINKPHDLAYVIYTSGTTGNPKGVMVEHESLAIKLIHEKQLLGLSKDMKSCLMTNYVFDVSILEILLPLMIGGCIAVPRTEIILNSDEIVKFLESNQVTILQGTPTYFKNILISNDSISKIDCVTTICLGGESLDEKIFLKIQEIFPNASINNHYGPTETVIDATSYLNIKNFPKNIIGKPLENTKVYMLDSNKKLQAIGVIGELYIGGVSLSRGYLNKNTLTEETFFSDPFNANGKMYKTGDLGRWLPDGNIEFIGRKDNQIKIRGYRVELGEIEKTILKASKIIKQAVVDVKIIKEEKFLVVYFTAHSKIDIYEIKETISRYLPDYMTPTYFVEIKEFFLNSNGKIDKTKFPEISEDNLIKNVLVLPGNDLEVQLLELWRNVLNIEKISVTDNFFDVGGNSILVTKLYELLKKNISQDISITHLFSMNSIRLQAQYISQYKPESIKQEEIIEIDF